MIADNITIDGVTISREQWELVGKMKGYATWTWEAFVTANTPKKARRDNGPLIYMSIPRSGGKSWIMDRINTAVLKQPAPRYKVGTWVVPPSGKPVQVSKSTWGSDRSANPIATYECGDHIWGESSLRPATREDFMKEFGGVKVWMEECNAGIILCHEDTDSTSFGDGWHRLETWEVPIYRAAGIMEMPKEFWIGHGLKPFSERCSLYVD